MQCVSKKYGPLIYILFFDYENFIFTTQKNTALYLALNSVAL